MFSVGDFLTLTTPGGNLDSQRKEDIKQIGQALKAYYADYGYYPSAEDPEALGKALVSKYLTELPEDPRLDGYYTYLPQAYGFRLEFILEDGKIFYLTEKGEGIEDIGRKPLKEIEQEASDAKRRSDVGGLATALSGYYTEHKVYPESHELTNTLIPKYLKEIPKDFVYTTSEQAQGYIIEAKLSSGKTYRITAEGAKVVESEN